MCQAVGETIGTKRNVYMQAKKRGRPASDKPQLSATKILDCAKVLMSANGRTPSIRAIASELDVDAMAIYYYFKNKNLLLEAMAVSLVEQIYEPLGELPWEEELEQLCRSYLELLGAYSGLLETLLRMETHSPADLFRARFEAIIARLGLDEGVRKDALDLLGDYLHGFALSVSCATAVSPSFSFEGPLKIYIRGLLSYRPI